MNDPAKLPRLLAALGLAMPLLAAVAQAPPLTAAERAQRDAEKVFSFIKFHSVPSRPAAEPRAKPARPVAASAERAALAARHAEAAAEHATTPAPAALASTAPAQPAALALPSATAPAPALPAAAVTTEPSVAAREAEAEPEPEQPLEDQDDAALQLVSFAPPVLTPAVQATLGAGSRQVKVRFTVEPNGRVSQAEAAAGVPRRLAKPATEAILQWQFAPLPQARTVDVEIAFRRD